jgi:hypothetical protein
MSSYTFKHYIKLSVMVPQILSLLHFLHREQNYWLILSVVLPFVSLVLHHCHWCYMHKIVNIQYTQEWFSFFVSIVRKIESVAFHEYAFLVLYLRKLYKFTKAKELNGTVFSYTCYKLKLWAHQVTVKVS